MITLLATTAAGTALVAATVAATAAAARVPTYRDVAPILREKCASCHVLGGIAAFPLRSAADAIARAQEILIVTRSGQMPPWPPGKDSPAFIGQSLRVLTAQEKDTIARWVRGGARR